MQTKHKPYMTRDVNGGVQHLFKFDNGYGASVIRHDFSYGGEDGLWELAVLEFEGEEWNLCYDTEVTDDVLGYLTDAEVEYNLDEIEKLEAK